MTPQSPTPGQALTEADVKLLRKGDWLLHSAGKWAGRFQSARPHPSVVIWVEAPRAVAGWPFHEFTFLGRPDQDGWIKHEGWRNPAAGLRVSVKCVALEHGNVPSEDLEWAGENFGLNIIAWRPVAPASDVAGGVERAVMVCPQCEGEGSYADGVDEAACTTECTRCGGNGWIVDVAALRPHVPSPASSSSVVQGDASGVGEWTDDDAKRYIADWCPDHVKDYIDRLAALRPQPSEGGEG